MNIDGMLNIWSKGQLLAFSGVDGQTSLLSGLVARVEDASLEIKAPASFKIGVPPPVKTCLAGDFFVLETSQGILKAAFADAFNLVLEGPCLYGDLPPELELAKSGSRLVVSAKGHLDNALLHVSIDALISKRKAWLESVKIPEGLSANAKRSLAKALSQLKTQIYAPEGRIQTRWTTPDRWPHAKMWLWDSAFHAIGLRHVDVSLAREALDSILAVQAPDGFIPHMGSPYEASKITQPPVLAFAAWLVNGSCPDKSWLASIYPKLKAYLQWDMAQRDTDGAGLLEWDIEGNPHCRSGESGADNSSRFDSAVQLDAPDFNSYLSLDMEHMASIASALGLEDDAESWRAQSARINALMNQRLWNEELGLYMDFDTKAGRQTDVMSFAGFLPLLCGAPSKAQAARLVEHLKNPETFGTPLPLPTIARCQPQYYSKDMWRGPVWTNINWLVARGLKRYGYDAEADALTRKTLEVVEAMQAKYGVFFEFYDDRKEDDPPMLLRKGRNDPRNPYHQPIRDYGWTATLYLDIIYTQEGRAP